MDIVELFAMIGVLEKARWRSRTNGHTVRIDRVRDQLLYISVEMPFLGGWIPEKPLTRRDFLLAYEPIREKS